ncbi:MAG: hypothetical protein ACLP52_12620 [Streptosporangiaceae bacterium]
MRGGGPGLRSRAAGADHLPDADAHLRAVAGAAAALGVPGRKAR